MSRETMHEVKQELTLAGKQELRLAGSGGQGVILASVIIAEAALLSGMNVAQSQSYGPEARGGSCKAEVVISPETIGFTKVQKPTFLMALTQKALEAYKKDLAPGCLILIDSSLELPADLDSKNIISVPVLETARKKVGKQQTANIVAVGCICKLLGIGTKKTVAKAVMMHVPHGTEALNEKALEEGFSLVEKQGASK
jgi:2-oxoglutarate ferredoxin oxidoreductase subunit gamma